MKLPNQPFAGARKPEDLLQTLRDAWEQLARIINALRFGSPTDGIVNVSGFWYSGTTPAVADTDFTITHNLGRVPVGFLIFSRDKAAIVYKGSVAWTTTQITLKCNVVSTAVVLFIH